MFLKVSHSSLHGNGCFATRAAGAGEIIGSNRILTFPPEEMAALFSTSLKNYLFYLKDGPDPDGPFHTALAMGPVSFCNHHPDPNCAFKLDEQAGEITLTALRAVSANEEVTIDYGDYAKEII